MAKPKRYAKCVFLSDVHFNLKNLNEATYSLSRALWLAKDLKCPLVIAGDLNDTKAILRAECVNAILKCFEDVTGVKTYVLIGNHDLVNEKSRDHSLGFLRPFACLVEAPLYSIEMGLWLLPYYADSDELLTKLKSIVPDNTVVMHQGFRGAHMGEYVVDKTSIDVSEVAHLRVITGHYHRRQVLTANPVKKILAGETIGTVTYLGTPYTVSFHEANDGPKGLNVLWSDGELELVPLDLRRHVIIECTAAELQKAAESSRLESNTILKVKVHGPSSELAKINKKHLGETILGHGNFQLEKIADRSEVEERSLAKKSRSEMLDDVIAKSEETAERKDFLKKLWREIADETA